MNEVNDTIDYSFGQENGKDLKITVRIKEFLLDTTKWAKFLAIVGFVFTGLIALFGLSVMVGGSFLPGFPSAMGFVYVLMSVIYFLPSLFMYKFATKTQAGFESNDANELEAGFENLKSQFKTIGIMTIVILSFYAIALLITLATAASFL